MKYIDLHNWENEKPDEKEYKESIIALLCDYFCHEDITFILTANCDSIPVHGSNVVVFLSANERSIVPQYHTKVGMIYTDFWNPDMPSHIKSIPLGLNERTSGRFIQTEPLMPISQREIDICFIGATHLANPHRREMIESVNRLDSYKKIINTYETFFYNVGAPNEDQIQRRKKYFDVLGSTKISLCPGGGNSHGSGYFPGWETYRFNESLRAGNIIITNTNWCKWYQGPNIFYIDSWNKLDNTFIDSILSQDTNLLQKQGIANYRQNLSRNAIQQDIINDIKNLIKL